jgi:hypothetical protein
MLPKDVHGVANILMPMRGLAGQNAEPRTADEPPRSAGSKLGASSPRSGATPTARQRNARWMQSEHRLKLRRTSRQPAGVGNASVG